MKIIFARSPYHYIIDEVGQTETKLELYLWESNAVQPTAPTYTFSELVPSMSQSAASYNIANQCRDFLDNLAPEYSNPIESSSMWAYGRVKGYAKVGILGSLAPTGLDETFVIVYGYTEYMDGANLCLENVLMFPMAADVKMINTIPATFTYNETTQTVPMAIDMNRLPYVNVLIEKQVNTTYFYEFISATEPNNYIQILPTDPIQMMKVYLNNWVNFYDYQFPYTVRLTRVKGQTITVVWSRNIVPDCNTKYQPLLCSFISKYGGWENIWFTRANEVSITTKSTDYNLSPQSVYYDPKRGQKQSFNTNGNKSIKCNTGFVEESLFSDMITQLMLSETVLLDGVPVSVKNTSSVLKTHLKEKNINYEIEFEYAFQMINNIS